MLQSCAYNRSVKLLAFLLFCASCSEVTAQQLKPTKVELTKGALSFDSKAVTFRTKDKIDQFTFPDPKKISFRAPALQIPGLRVQNFELRSVRSPDGDISDASRLTFVTEDGTVFALLAGQPVEVYRIEITFADHQLTLWHLASNLK